jgi:putative membrane protein
VASQRRLSDYFGVSLRGAAMGIADAIPGVSGGTVAFITGIYEELIASLSAIGPARLGQWRREGFGAVWRTINGTFLLSLFAGLLLALALVAEAVSWLLQHHRMLLWGFFFALILASVPLVMTKLKTWRPGVLLWLLPGTAFGLGVTLLTPGATPQTLWMVVIAGVIAVSAMVLPGISGSFLLLLLGQYEPMVNAVAERQWLTLLAFAAGAAVGMMTISRLLSVLLRRHHDATVTLLAGFMLGSANALWPWQSGDGATLHWPWQFAAATGESAQWLAVSGCMLAGLVVAGVAAHLGRAKVS